MDVIELSLADPDRTIRELLDDAFQSPAADIDEIRQHWRSSLDYAIKMLLYLSVRNAQVTHDRACSEAPRNFTGLGRRKRKSDLPKSRSYTTGILSARLCWTSYPSAPNRANRVHGK